MDTILNTIQQNMSLNMWIGVFAAIAVIILLSVVISVLKQKKAKAEQERLEAKYNEMRGIPLAFKLNKAEALSRVSSDMNETVSLCKEDFDKIQEELRECSVLLAEADDALYLRKRKIFYRNVEELDRRLDSAKASCDRVDLSLNGLLEQENEQRQSINVLKEEFRNVKASFLENRGLYAQSLEYMELKVKSIESDFSEFEEWMFASEFHKANDKKGFIGKEIEQFKELMNELPEIYEQVKGVLPRAMDEVGFQYAEAKNIGVLCDHLEVTKNLEIISDMIASLIARLRDGNTANSNEVINDCSTRIAQLKELLSKEVQAHHEVHDTLEDSYREVKQINREVEEISTLYNRVNERFGFENWTERLSITNQRLDALNELKRNMEKLLSDKEEPATVVLVTYKELRQGIQSFSAEVQVMKDELLSACSDEERAKKQLIKLQLIVNEMRGKIARHRLPNISVTFNDDLNKSLLMIDELQTILNHSPLDIELLNKSLKQAIDYTYTLYNSVNNLVGMAMMVENVIVFGNRYRSTYTEIDTELTRAELCFRNGEFTKALKIAIQSIEKLHPGIYDKLSTTSEQESIGAKVNI